MSSLEGFFFFFLRCCKNVSCICLGWSTQDLVWRNFPKRKLIAFWNDLSLSFRCPGVSLEELKYSPVPCVPSRFVHHKHHSGIWAVITSDFLEEIIFIWVPCWQSHLILVSKLWRNPFIFPNLWYRSFYNFINNLWHTAALQKGLISVWT